MKVDRSFKKLSNVLPYLLAFVDNERRYKFVNTAYEGFFRCKTQNIKGKSIAEVVGEESYGKISELHDRVLKGEEIGFTDKVNLRDGRTILLDIKYVPNFEGLSKKLMDFSRL